MWSWNSQLLKDEIYLSPVLYFLPSEWLATLLRFLYLLPHPISRGSARVPLQDLSLKAPPPRGTACLLRFPIWSGALSFNDRTLPKGGSGLVE